MVASWGVARKTVSRGWCGTCEPFTFYLLKQKVSGFSLPRSRGRVFTLSHFFTFTWINFFARGLTSPSPALRILALTPGLYSPTAFYFLPSLLHSFFPTPLPVLRSTPLSYPSSYGGPLRVEIVFLQVSLYVSLYPILSDIKNAFRKRETLDWFLYRDSSFLSYHHYHLCQRSPRKHLLHSPHSLLHQQH
jgi:hypothetical protein